MVIIFLVFHKLGPYKNSLQIVTIEWHAYVDFVGGGGGGALQHIFKSENTTVILPRSM